MIDSASSPVSTIPPKGGTSQPSPSVPRSPRQTGEKCDSSGATQRRPTLHRQIPMPAATVKKEHFQSGAWIWQHFALDAECVMLPEYEEEYLRTRAEFMEQCNLTF